MSSVAVTDENFENEVLKADKPVLVDFWAEWCGPCKTLLPLVEELAGEMDAVNLIDVRKPGEYTSEHVENATHYPLDYMNDDLNKILGKTVLLEVDWSFLQTEKFKNNSESSRHRTIMTFPSIAKKGLLGNSLS